MGNDDSFLDSVPDGLSIAINDFDEEIECSGQDGYELLVRSFGRNVRGDTLRSATQAEFEVFARQMRDYFELDYLPSAGDAQGLIRRALAQWRS